jgi:muramoyltetrapeptide carboxypeptidase
MNPPSSATRPRALTAGTRVALVAPAGPLEAERIAASEGHCRALDLEPVVFPFATARHRYLTGTDAERLADLQAAFDDESIGAVWALRGGYGTLRILEALDLRRQRHDPIPFLGFSDNTSIHARHAELGVVSFHAPHPAPAMPAEAEEWLRRLLYEAEPAGELPVPEAGPAPQVVRSGMAEGPLVGGNLAILSSLCGTRHALRAEGAILALEDVGEPAYRVDRMLLQLERAGTVDGAVGLALGRFTDEGGEAADGVREVLSEFAERVSLPGVADLSFGHVTPHFALPLGVRARLDAERGALAILEPAVRSSGPA